MTYPIIMATEELKAEYNRLEPNQIESMNREINRLSGSIVKWMTGRHRDLTYYPNSGKAETIGLEATNKIFQCLDTLVQLTTHETIHGVTYAVRDLDALYHELQKMGEKKEKKGFLKKGTNEGQIAAINEIASTVGQGIIKITSSYTTTLRRMTPAVKAVEKGAHDAALDTLEVKA